MKEFGDKLLLICLAGLLFENSNAGMLFIIKAPLASFFKNIRLFGMSKFSI